MTALIVAHRMQVTGPLNRKQGLFCRIQLELESAATDDRLAAGCGIVVSEGNFRFSLLTQSAPGRAPVLQK
ncbi:MAG: hypothetical protein V2G42_00790 [bacterium JZ-2024 1]